MGTDTRLMQEISEQFLNCKLCSQNLQEPKTLTCLHTFCLPCLQAHYDTESNSRSGRYSLFLRHVTCPVCQKRTDLPTGGVRRLPDNFLVSNLTDVLAKRTVSTDAPCEICLTVRSKTVEASNKCLDCGKLLCTHCVDLHRSTKVTQHHSLIDVQGEKNIKCKVHEEEHVRFYCSPCDACICVVCAFQEHRGHDVCAFNEVSPQHRLGLEAQLQQVRARLGDVTDRLAAFHKRETSIQEAREKIRDLAISYISEVRRKERALLREMDELCGDMSKAVDDKNTLQEYQSDLESSCSLTDIILKGSGVEFLLVKRDIQTKMEDLLELVLPEMPTDAQCDVTFVPGNVTLGRLSFGGDDVESTGTAVAANGDISANLKGTSSPDLIINNNSNHNSNTCTSISSHNNGISATNFRTSNTHTTMQADMGMTLSHSDTQTDQPSETTPTSPNSRLTRSRGIMATPISGRARGTMTERSDTRSLKCQTDSPGSSNQSSTNDVRSADGKLSGDQASDMRNESHPAPDLLPPSPYLFSYSRHPKTKKIQTDISALDVNGAEIPDNGDLIKLMAAAKLLENDIKPEARRPRRKRTVDTGVMTEELRPTTTTAPNTTDRGSSPVHELTSRAPPPLPQIHESYTQHESSLGSQLKIEKATTVSSSNIVKTDKETSTPLVILETRATATDVATTCDRATDTLATRTSDRAVGTVAIRKESVGLQALPRVTSTTTNTPIQTTTDKECQVTPDVTDVVKMARPVSELQTSHNKNNNMTVVEESITDTVQAARKFQTRDQCLDAIVIPRPSKSTETVKVKMLTTATETVKTKLVNQDTSTTLVKTVDQWTETLTPQMVNTGISPPRPATLDTGVATTVVLTNEEGTCTDVKMYRESHTETVLSVCDNETLTDRPCHSDAQTGEDFATESEGCGTDAVTHTDQGSMTDFSHLVYTNDGLEAETQLCHQCGRVTSGFQHPFSTPGTSRSPGGEKPSGPNQPLVTPVPRAAACLQTQNVGTMAMSCVTRSPSLQDTGVQTQSPRLLDKQSSTSFDWSCEFQQRPFTRETQEAATSTESLPYIGLLSEIDVDDLLVIPEAAFELVSDTDSEADRYDVIMVDDETSTEFVQCVEEGTQTPASPSASVGDMNDRSEDNEMAKSDSSGCSGVSGRKKGVGEVIKSFVSREDHHDWSRREVDKQAVSIGVNTIPKLTFEKETCTPMRHLFSKGTMTFFVSKMDKSTSTFHSSLFGRVGGPGKNKSVDKVTMTSNTDRKDVSVETESTKLDGKITECISKLRSVSERLNSPTSINKSGIEGETFFDNYFAGSKTVNPNFPAGNSPTKPTVFGTSSSLGKPESDRQKQLKHLLDEVEGSITSRDPSTAKVVCPQTGNMMPPKETPTVRKPQPLTTLRGRKPAIPKRPAPENNPDSYEVGKARSGSQSLPRSGVVRMGSQPLPSSRLPLLRYNSAPGRMATSPITTTSPEMSPTPPRPLSQSLPGSKIPITKKKSPEENGAVVVTPDLKIESSCPKPQLRRPLPSITETRTSSSCSDASNSSFVSASSSTISAHGHSDNPATTSPPENVGTWQQSALTPTEAVKAASTHSLPSAFLTPPTSPPKLQVPQKDPKTSSTSELTKMPTTTSNSSLDADAIVSSTDTLDGRSSPSEKPRKHGGMGFMQRLLSKKKKTTSDTKKTAKTKAPNKDKSPVRPTATITSTSNSSCTPSTTPAAVGKASPSAKRPIPTSAVAAALLPMHAPIPGPGTPGSTPVLCPQLKLPPHHYPPPPEPKSPEPPRKPRPFVYVRQRAFSIQQDNVEEATEKRRGSKDHGAAEMSSSTSSTATSENTAKAITKQEKKNTAEKEKVKKKVVKKK